MKTTDIEQITETELQENPIDARIQELAAKDYKREFRQKWIKVLDGIVSNYKRGIDEMLKISRDIPKAYLDIYYSIRDHAFQLWEEENECRLNDSK